METNATAEFIAGLGGAAAASLLATADEVIQ
jgi:hypothetical protein